MGVTLAACCQIEKNSVDQRCAFIVQAAVGGQAAGGGAVRRIHGQPCNCSKVNSSHAHACNGLGLHFSERDKPLIAAVCDCRCAPNMLAAVHQTCNLVQATRPRG